jgi:hypothetical protein
MTGSLAGTARASALAVFRLIINSNLLGCTIGKSAGLLAFENARVVEAD